MMMFRRTGPGMKIAEPSNPMTVSSPGDARAATSAAIEHAARSRTSGTLILRLWSADSRSRSRLGASLLSIAAVIAIGHAVYLAVFAPKVFQSIVELCAPQVVGKDGKPIADEDPEKFVRKDGTKGRAVQLSSIHLDIGFHCVDCHWAQDMHGNGRLQMEVRAACEIQCIDCHGTSAMGATLRTSGPAASMPTMPCDKSLIASCPRMVTLAPHEAVLEKANGSFVVAP